MSLTISCKLRAKTPNKANDNNREVTGRTTSAKPVRRRRRNKNRFPSALAPSRKRHARFLEKKLAGKPDLALPEEKSITTVPGVPDAVDPLCVKELENTSPVGGSSRDLVSLEDPTSSPDSDPDLSIMERAILRKFLDTVYIDSDDSDDDLGILHCACSSFKRPPKKGEELKRCSALFALSHNPLLQRSVPEERLGLSPVCLLRCGQEVGHCKSLKVATARTCIYC